MYVDPWRMMLTLEKTAQNLIGNLERGLREEGTHHRDRSYLENY